MGRKPALRVRLATLRRRDPGHASEAQPPTTTNAESDQGEYRMNCFRLIRLALVALVPAAAISLGIATALAESPAATSPAATPPPAASPSAAPAKPAAAAEPPATPSPAAAPVQAADPF